MRAWTMCRVFSDPITYSSSNCMQNNYLFPPQHLLAHALTHPHIFIHMHTGCEAQLFNEGKQYPISNGM